MKIGYARVSTADQHLRMQEDALKQAGCKKIYHDTASGTKADRPGLGKALEQLREGDVLVVWKLDRLGRSLRNLIDIIQQLQDQNIGFQSLRESIDTTTTGGKLVFHIFSALAEFERDLIRDRTQAGLQAARARGKKGGRPAQLSSKEITKMIGYYQEGKNTVDEICKIFGIGRTCFYNYLRKEKRAIQVG
jgi:DNA invertase Pin-like site-specific DNA recombinase